MSQMKLAFNMKLKAFLITFKEPSLVNKNKLFGCESDFK